MVLGRQERGLTAFAQLVSLFCSPVEKLLSDREDPWDCVRGCKCFLLALVTLKGVSFGRWIWSRNGWCPPTWPSASLDGHHSKGCV